MEHFQFEFDLIESIVSHQKELKIYSSRLMQNWGIITPPEPEPEKLWIPKNPEVNFPVSDEVVLSN